MKGVHRLTCRKLAPWTSNDKAAGRLLLRANSQRDKSKSEVESTAETVALFAHLTFSFDKTTRLIFIWSLKFTNTDMTWHQSITQRDLANGKIRIRFKVFWRHNGLHKGKITTPCCTKLANTYDSLTQNQLRFHTKNDKFFGNIC